MNRSTKQRSMPAEHVVLRLADEGVPVAAISRALKRPSDQLWPLIEEALFNGQLAVRPAADWRPGSRRDDRVPQKAPVRAADFEQLTTDLRLAFDLEPAESRLLALLMVRDDAPRAALQSAVRGPGGIADPGALDACADALRRKLARRGIGIETIRGDRYVLPLAAAARLRRRVVEIREVAEGVADAE
jgi:hypothetical protein